MGFVVRQSNWKKYWGLALWRNATAVHIPFFAKIFVVANDYLTQPLKSSQMISRKCKRGEAKRNVAEAISSSSPSSVLLFFLIFILVKHQIKSLFRHLATELALWPCADEKVRFENLCQPEGHTAAGEKVCKCPQAKWRCADANRTVPLFSPSFVPQGEEGSIHRKKGDEVCVYRMKLRLGERQFCFASFWCPDMYMVNNLAKDSHLRPTYPVRD